ncbi:MAG: hypothetical protein LBB88_00475 [Planctomycetaceae bacterium]|nr:hypothetical protein [Planctomycetaceae bacterium]
MVSTIIKSIQIYRRLMPTRPFGERSPTRVGGRLPDLGQQVRNMSVNS